VVKNVLIELPSSRDPTTVCQMCWLEGKGTAINNTLLPWMKEIEMLTQLVNKYVLLSDSGKEINELYISYAV
jgi:hypothetical protein